jgi:hypothetical protein
MLMMKRFLVAAALLASVLLAAPASATITVSIANAAAGTTNGLLAKLTGAPSTALTTAITDTGGIIGVVVSGGGATGNALIATDGIAPCTFDASGVVAGHYVQNSTTTAGMCKDGGATYPTSGQVLGIALATVASGSANMVVIPPGNTPTASSGASVAGNNTWTGTNFFNGAQLYASVRVVPGVTDTLVATDCGHAISYTSATAVALTTLNSLPVGCAITVIQSAAGQVTVGPGAGSTLSSVNTYTKTKAQNAIIGLTVDANVGGTAAHFILSGDGA